MPYCKALRGFTELVNLPAVGRRHTVKNLKISILAFRAGVASCVQMLVRCFVNALHTHCRDDDYGFLKCGRVTLNKGY